MSSILKNVASQNITFCLVNASTGAALTGATVTGFVTKDGTQANAAGTFTELKVSAVGHGAYNYAPTQAETNCTNFGLLCTATSAIPVNLDFHTDIVDANGLPSVNMADILGTAVASPATAGIPDVNVKNINNVAAATPGAAGGVFIAGANAATSVTTALTANITGNVSGSVGSVTAAVGITSNRKKAATATFEFTMTNSTTGVDQTGLTVSSFISKDGAAFASTTNAVTEIARGYYQLVLTGTEMTANNISLQMTASGANNRDISVQTQP